MIKLNIEKSLKEINSKTYSDIVKEYAVECTNNAAASYYSISHGGLTPPDALRRLIEAEAFTDQALNYASKAEDLGVMVHEVQVALKPYQDHAIQAINNHLLQTTTP